MIELNDVVKKYGKKTVLDRMNLTIEEGKIIGLLGINGVGKSTTLKAITGLVPINKGKILIDGEPISANTLKKISFLPDAEFYFSHMNLKEMCDFMKVFHQDWDDEKANRLIEYFRLDPSVKIKTLSKGNRAKAKLVLTLGRRAKYILLDEPFSGIDILTREDFIHVLLQEFMDYGQTMIITTHEVNEVEKILDEVIFIEDGKVFELFNLEERKLKQNESLSQMMRRVYQYA